MANQKNNPSRPERARVEKGDSGGKPDKQPNDDRKAEGDKGQGGWFGAARRSPKSSIAPAKQSKFWVRFWASYGFVPSPLALLLYQSLQFNSRSVSRKV
jgi:hypothetical protein